jgi:hypothetical protein
LIPDDIFERGLISAEILPITTMLEVIERKVGFVPPWIEALIRMESIEISNEIHVLTGSRVIDTHMAYLSAFLTRHAGIDQFEVIETWNFEFLLEKINLGSEHIHVFKLVGAGLSVFIIPTLTRGYLFN